MQTNNNTKIHSKLLGNLIFSILLSASSASQAFAANCPRGYGKIKSYTDTVTKIAVLDYETRYSPHLLEECIDEGRTFRCGKYNFEGMINQIYRAIIPSNKGLRNIVFGETYNTDSWDRLGVDRMGKDIVPVETPTKRWCEQQNNEVFCYETWMTRRLYFEDNIQKKLVDERTFREITRCALITF